MAEVFELEHLLRVRSRDGDEPVVPHERGQTALRALLVDEIEKLAFGDRVRREIEIVRKVELLGVVLAELCDEERRPAEGARDGRDLRLIRGELVAHRTPGAAPGRPRPRAAAQ